MKVSNERKIGNRLVSFGRVQDQYHPLAKIHIRLGLDHLGAVLTNAEAEWVRDGLTAMIEANKADPNEALGGPPASTPEEVDAILPATRAMIRNVLDQQRRLQEEIEERRRRDADRLASYEQRVAERAKGIASSFPEVSVRVGGMLWDAGYRQWEDVKGASDHELRAIRNFGAGSIREVRHLVGYDGEDGKPLSADLRDALRLIERSASLLKHALEEGAEIIATNPEGRQP